MASKHVKFGSGLTASVTVGNSVCIAVHAYRDEWDGQSWSRMLQNPVRQVTEVLQASGSARPFEAPFGREFRLQGSIAAPANADTLAFNAQVPKDTLDSLLRRSGFNKIWLVPRMWQQEPLPEYTIVWIAGDKEAAAQAAARLPSQLGLVRAKITGPSQGFQQSREEPPTRELLRFLGVPAQVFNFWHASLARLTRVFKIRDTLGPQVASTTVLSEGCPASVLTAVCAFFVQQVQDFVEVRTYVDNWSWLADALDCHPPAFQALQEVTEALSIPIDCGKSYFWAPDPADRKWWHANQRHLLPQNVHPPCTIPGSWAHTCPFQRKVCLGQFHDRVAEGLNRLHRLFHDPTSIQAKSKVVQQGGWPYLFCGSFALAPGDMHFKTLRGNAARAIIGRHHTLSPHMSLHVLPFVQDPSVFHLCQLARLLRRAFSVLPSVAAAVLARACQVEDTEAVCGPATADFAAGWAMQGARAHLVPFAPFEPTCNHASCRVFGPSTAGWAMPSPAFHGW